MKDALLFVPRLVLFLLTCMAWTVVALAYYMFEGCQDDGVGVD